MSLNSKKLSLIFILALILAIPGLTLLLNLSTANFFSLPHSESEITYTFARLFGLYAFTLIFIQILTGHFRGPISLVFGAATRQKFHITTGIFTLLLALTHPFLINFSRFLDGIYPTIFTIIPTFTKDAYTTYTSIGLVGLYLMILTVSAALLRKRKFIQKHWFGIHKLNFLLFFLIFTHSFLLGSDVKTYPFFVFYIAAFGVVLAIVFGKTIKILETTKKQP